jgi:hypothetical protein
MMQFKNPIGAALQIPLSLIYQLSDIALKYLYGAAAQNY